MGHTGKFLENKGKYTGLQMDKTYQTRDIEGGKSKKLFEPVFEEHVLDKAKSWDIRDNSLKIKGSIRDTTQAFVAKHGTLRVKN